MSPLSLELFLCSSQALAGPASSLGLQTSVKDLPASCQQLRHMCPCPWVPGPHHQVPAELAAGRWARQELLREGRPLRPLGCPGEKASLGACL